MHIVRPTVLGQLIPLAVLSAVTSPTAMAAVLVILKRPRAVSLMTAYVVGSMITSVLVGIGLVAAFKATGAFPPHHDTSKPIFEITVGVAILVSAAWLHSERSANLRRGAAERLAERRTRKKARSGNKPSRSTRILNKGSVGLVAALGAAMHLPGLLYLVALSDIASANLTTLRERLVIVVFNLVMLLPIELPLLGSIVDPQRTQDAVKNVDAFVHQHKRSGTLITAAVTGGYLIAIGIVALAR